MAKDVGVETAMPCSIEIQSSNHCQHVDSTGGNAELRDHVGSSEVIDFHAHPAKRRTERNERSVNPPGVGGIGPNPNIHVSGGSWQTMRCQGDAANDEEPDIVFQERIDEVTEIGVHGPGSSRVERPSAATGCAGCAQSPVRSLASTFP